ncbi:MAG: U32 family peptidase [Deltaproteobacteria bacterium]|jgi:putative protease|nr:U32 family peptidase [Deltaproteobacteria bacterium]
MAPDPHLPLSDSLKKPEILAPAGSPASWAAALEAGADAVYAGLDRFSARTGAENFNITQIKGLIEESHRLGVKVYLAFNAAIKDDELAPAFKAMIAAAEMEPDGFIVQDLGLASLALKHCPNVPLHASTLTAVHTLEGLNALKNLGFNRAVLARELSLKEIGELTKKSPLETEVFIHGALCFSFSGLCLMSSFLGGRSSLRGACTQPCRRLWRNAGRLKTFFSFSDFSAASFIPELKKMPLAAFKIEGRMKGPDYVSNTVKAYRLLLSASDEKFEPALEEAYRLLNQSPARRLGPGFMAGDSFCKSLWDGQAVSGQRAGFLTPLGPDKAQVALQIPLRLYDRLRLVAEEGLEGQAFKLKRIWLDDREVEGAEAGQTIIIATSRELNLSQGVVYKIGSAASERQYLRSESVARLNDLAKSFNPPEPSPLPASIARHFERGAPAGKVQPLWFWLDNVEIISELISFNPKKIILPISVEIAKELNRQKKRLGFVPPVVWSLPPLTFGSTQDKLIKEVSQLFEAGYRDFMLSNIGQITLLKRLKLDLKLWGDHHLGAFNHLHGQSLVALGLSGVTYSLEIDQQTLSNLVQSRSSGAVLFYLYGRPALFTARFRPPSLKRGPIVSGHGEKFWSASEGDSFILQSEHRVFIVGLLKAPKPNGFSGLIVDLRREPNPVEAARRVKKAVSQNKSAPGLSFNFKRGLK